MQLLEHLQRSTQRLHPPRSGALDQRHVEYVEGFQADRPPDPIQYRLQVPLANRSLALSAADYLLRAEQFDTGAGPDHDRGTLDGRFEHSFGGQEGWLAWLPRNTEALRLAFGIHLEVGTDGATTLFTNHQLPTWAEEFERRLISVLNRTPEDLTRLFGADPAEAGIPHDLLLGPGERLTGPFTGMLWDYSGCAAVEAVADLTTGDLPLGRWAFGFAEYGVRYGPDLFLSRYRTGAPMMYNGALICAPRIRARRG